MTIFGGIFPGGSSDPFKGATGTDPGKPGIVPAPDAGEQNFFLKGDGTWAPAAGSGDVVGPDSSTDNAVVRFDGVTGKVIQDSNVILDDVGNMSGLASIETLAVVCDSNDLTIGTVGTGNIVISSPDNTIIQGLVYPNIDGLNGQILATDGNGNLNFVDQNTGGNTWNVVTTNTTMAPGNNYITDDVAKIELTLPASAPVGTVFEIGGFGSGGWEVKQGAGQQIHFGRLTTTQGASGSIASTDAKDSIKLVCVREDTDYLVVSSVGNLNLI